MTILESYLIYLNEGLFFKPNCYCNILEYKQNGFEKIFYVGVKNSTQFKKISPSFSLFFPLTKPNYEGFINHEDTIAPIFGNIFGKFSIFKISKSIRDLKILDSGFADVKFSMLNSPVIYNFKKMKTFNRDNYINFNYNAEEQKGLVFLKLHGKINNGDN